VKSRDKPPNFFSVLAKDTLAEIMKTVDSHHIFEKFALSRIFMPNSCNTCPILLENFT